MCTQTLPRPCEGSTLQLPAILPASLSSILINGHDWLNKIILWTNMSKASPQFYLISWEIHLSKISLYVPPDRSFSQGFLFSFSKKTYLFRSPLQEILQNLSVAGQQKLKILSSKVVVEEKQEMKRDVHELMMPAFKNNTIWIEDMPKSEKADFQGVFWCLEKNKEHQRLKTLVYGMESYASLVCHHECLRPGIMIYRCIRRPNLINICI